MQSFLRDWTNLNMFSMTNCPVSLFSWMHGSVPHIRVSHFCIITQSIAHTPLHNTLGHSRSSLLYLNPPSLLWCRVLISACLDLEDVLVDGCCALGMAYAALVLLSLCFPQPPRPLAAAAVCRHCPTADDSKSTAWPGGLRQAGCQRT